MFDSITTIQSTAECIASPNRLWVIRRALEQLNAPEADQFYELTSNILSVASQMQEEGGRISQCVESIVGHNPQNLLH